MSEQCVRDARVVRGTRDACQQETPHRYHNERVLINRKL